jgi:hypothetical protein
VGKGDQEKLKEVHNMYAKEMIINLQVLKYHIF